MVVMMIYQAGKNPKMRITYKRKQQGFVLIDVIVAILIISITLTAILSGYALAGRAAANMWPEAIKIIQERNEFEELPRIKLP